MIWCPTQPILPSSPPLIWCAAHRNGAPASGPSHITGAKAGSGDPTAHGSYFPLRLVCLPQSSGTGSRSSPRRCFPPSWPPAGGSRTPHTAGWAPDPCQDGCTGVSRKRTSHTFVLATLQPFLMHIAGRRPPPEMRFRRPALPLPMMPLVSLPDCPDCDRPVTMPASASVPTHASTPIHPFRPLFLVLPPVSFKRLHDGCIPDERPRRANAGAGPVARSA